MPSKFLDELRELRNIVNQSSLHTERQLQSIDTTLLVKSLVAFILSLGLTFIFKIMIYWLPASFLLMYLWALYSLRSTMRGIKFEEVHEAYQKHGRRTFDYGYVWFFRNISPLIKALCIIYAVTLVVLVLIGTKTLDVEQQFSIVIPAISAFIFILPSFFLDNVIKFSAKGGFSESLNKFWSIERSKGLVILVILVIVLIFLAYVIFILVLPGLSLWVIRSIYYPIGGDSFFVILILILQVIVLAMFASYFSSLSVKKELTNTLTNFANIDYQINSLIMSGVVKRQAVEELKNLYLAAKPYDLVVDDYFKFVNYYILAMHKVYLTKLKELSPRQ